jgi:hypothetical protein
VQVVHGEQEVTLLVALKSPGAHGEHVWSVVVDPSVATCSPGVHVVHGVHDGALLVDEKLPEAQCEQA